MFSVRVSSRRSLEQARRRSRGSVGVLSSARFPDGARSRPIPPIASLFQEKGRAYRSTTAAARDPAEVTISTRSPLWMRPPRRSLVGAARSGRRRVAVAVQVHEHLLHREAQTARGGIDDPVVGLVRHEGARSSASVPRPRAPRSATDSMARTACGNIVPAHVDRVRPPDRLEDGGMRGRRPASPGDGQGAVAMEPRCEMPPGLPVGRAPRLRPRRRRDAGVPVGQSDPRKVLHAHDGTVSATLVDRALSDGESIEERTRRRCRTRTRASRRGSPTMHAVDGNVRSPVTVPTMIWSSPSLEVPRSSAYRRHAWRGRTGVSGSEMRRSLIPVRLTIHSSECPRSAQILVREHAVGNVGPGSDDVDVTVRGDQAASGASFWSSARMESATFASAQRAATRIAFLMARTLERPCAMMQVPSTPRSGAPPTSE